MNYQIVKQMKSYTVHIFLVGLLVSSACSRSATVDPDAAAMIAKGTELISQGGEANLRDGIGTFGECTEVAPNYAPCYAGLATAYASIGGNYNIMPPEEAWPAAREAAEKAVELDDKLAAAHRALAQVIAGQDWDWAVAEQEYQRAIELDPNDISTLFSYAWFQFDIGSHDEAAATLATIRDLDPAFPIGYLEYMVTGNPDRARREAEELVASDPENPGGYWFSANMHVREGEWEQAATQLQKQIPLMDGDVVDEVALLGHVYGRMGREAEAREMLARLDEVSREGRYVSPVNKAWIHAGLGEADETLELLQEGVETRAHRSGLGMTSFGFVFEPISDDPRFGALLAQIGFDD